MSADLEMGQEVLSAAERCEALLERDPGLSGNPWKRAQVGVCLIARVIAETGASGLVKNAAIESITRLDGGSGMDWRRARMLGRLYSGSKN